MGTIYVTDEEKSELESLESEADRAEDYLESAVSEFEDAYKRANSSLDSDLHSIADRIDREYKDAYNNLSSGLNSCIDDANSLIREANQKTEEMISTLEELVKL